MSQPAVAALDRLLANRSTADFTDATRHLAAYRDELVLIWRRTASETDRSRLARVNAVLSVVLGGQYPTGDVAWPAIQQARGDLAALTAET